RPDLVREPRQPPRPRRRDRLRHSRLGVHLRTSVRAALASRRGRRRARGRAARNPAADGSRPRVIATDPADLGVVEAGSLPGRGERSATELTEACLARIRERDGTHSRDGDLGSINAWVRVYAEDALATARRLDSAPWPAGAPLRGIPIGLKDLFAV